MTPNPPAFRERYGPWAVVAGASEGLGEAFAREAARLGLHLVLVARRAEALETLAADLRRAHGVEVRTLPADLGDAVTTAAIAARTADLEVGLLVYNAALSVTAPFLDQPLEQHSRAIDVNCRAPLALAHTFGRRMRERRRGGILLMSSLTGFQGSPLLATYGATKAFNLVLGEGLWDELREAGVHVLVVAAGATTTPGYLKSRPGRPGLFEPAPLHPDAVAREALAGLAAGPVLVPGRLYRLVSWLLHHLVPRRTAVRLMGRTARSLQA